MYIIVNPYYVLLIQDEGFALDWSSSGQLLTGDCHGTIHLWQPQQSRSWHVDQRPYTAHSKSVEDIQWSPNESTVSDHCLLNVYATALVVNALGLIDSLIILCSFVVL